MDYRYEVKLGNVLEQNLFDIWRSDLMNEYRKTLLGGERKMFCDGCDVELAESNSTIKDLPKRLFDKIKAITR